MPAHTRRREPARPPRTPANAAIRLSAAIILLLAAAPNTDAHNGSLAYAYPIDPVTIDGDLSDWPDDMGRFPIAMLYVGPAPSGPEDCEGYYQIGYNELENALYIGVTATLLPKLKEYGVQ